MIRKHVRSNLSLVVTTLVALSLVACSASQTRSPEEEALDGAAPADATAQTDAAPADSAEIPAAAPTEEKPADPLAANDVSAPAPADAPPADPAAQAPAPDAAAANLAPPAEPAKEAEAPKDTAVAAAPPAEPTPPAAAEPVGQAAGESSVSGSGQFTEHRVQSSDTLMKIAFEVYGDLYQWKKIYKDNKDQIKDPNSIPSGTVLKIEQPSNPVAVEKNGDRYLIKAGDTLGTISDSIYGTPKKWKKLWENNKQLIRNPNKIFAGFTLYYTVTEEERQQLATKQKDKASASAAPTRASANRSPASASPAVVAPAAVKAAPAPAAAPALKAPAGK